MNEHRLPDALRPVLATPFGPVHATDSAIAAARATHQVVAVGDVVTQTLLDHGIVPKLMVVDGVTQRGTKVEAALRGLPARGVTHARVDNPPARITRALWQALEAGLGASESCVITVNGEEDLAALPAMILADDGAVVLYGQPPHPTHAPGGGVVVVVVTSVVRERANHILNQMEVT